MLQIAVPRFSPETPADRAEFLALRGLSLRVQLICSLPLRCSAASPGGTDRAVNPAEKVMATISSFGGGSVVQFTRRFMGALVLDPVTFEDVEADPHSGPQAAIVVLLACAGGGLAAVGSSSMNLATFVAGMAMTLGAWVVWALLITTIGTHLFPEPQTSSRTGELLRTMGFAAAPGLFLAFGAMRSAAPFAFAVASIWLVAATVLAVRQALDYRSLSRAVVVCVIAWLLTFGITAGAGMLLTRPVS
jgi:hypothetical protein